MIVTDERVNVKITLQNKYTPHRRNDDYQVPVVIRIQMDHMNHSFTSMAGHKYAS